MRGIVGSSLFALAWLLSSTASAQPPEWPVSEVDDQSARALYEDGAEAFREGAYERSADRFLAGYERSPRALLLYNAGVAFDRLAHTVRAMDCFRAFLATRYGGRADYRHLVQGRIRVLENAFARGVPPSREGQLEMR